MTAVVDMPFRSRAEIILRDNTVVDVTADVRWSAGYTITRGRRSEAQRVEPGSLTLTLNNRHGKYSPRNPLSPYYGLIGRNTPLILHTLGGEHFCRINGPGDRARTDSSTDLDVTADLDVRLELALSELPALDDHVAGWTELIGRYNATGSPGQRMWRLMLNPSGGLFLGWSTDGDDSVFAHSTVVVPYRPGQRWAARATLDVDNGSGGHTVTFYTAPSLAGPWQRLGDPVEGSGTTSINQIGDASLEIGDINTTSFEPALGRIYGAELRDGIDGPLLASPDFTAQPLGAASFNDAQGITWDFHNGAFVSEAYRRFSGEVSSWPQRWDVSGNDVWVPITASGVLRRYGQGASPLQSTLRRYIPTNAELLAYWPMEDGAEATSAASGIVGGSTLTVSGLTFAADSGLVSSGPLPTVSDGATASAPLPALPASAAGDQWRAEMVYYLDAEPSGDPTPMLEVQTSGGGISRVVGLYSTNGIRVQVYDDDGALLGQFTNTNAADIAEGATGWSRFILRAFPDSGNTRYAAEVTPIGSTALSGAYHDQPNFTEPRRLATTWAAAVAGMPVGHITYVHDATVAAHGGGTGAADDAWRGESALDRVRRLAEEEALQLAALGYAADAQDVGPQKVDTALNLVRQAAAADGGVLYEPRELLFRLHYLPQHMLYNRPVGLVLNYDAGGNAGEVAPPLNPTDDDQRSRNHIIVSRTDGSSAEAVLETGPMSVQDPPAGIGRYRQPLTLNVARDGQLEPIAYWKLHIGTADEMRFPRVTINLANSRMTALRQTVLDQLDVGARLQITNPPAWLPAETVDLIVEGYTETIRPDTWTVTANCSPARPWTVGEVAADDPDDNLGPAHVDTDGHVLSTAPDATVTEVAVVPTAWPWEPWSRVGSDAPWDLEVGGERMTCTAVTGDTALDVFGRSETDGWGTASSGQAWTTSGGSASDYSVSSGVGQISVGTLDTSRFVTMTAGSDADFSLAVSCATDVEATGTEGHRWYLLGRFADTSNYYGLRTEFTETQTVELTMFKIVGGSATVFTTVTVSGLTHAADTKFRMRFEGQGTALKGRVWLASGTEPTAWDIEQTDSDLTAAGDVGVRAQIITGNTNTLPVVYSYTDFHLAQTMDVTRSVNGVSKAHAAATDVRLADPMIVAL